MSLRSFLTRGLVKGFTLVELLVVIAVIAILAIVVLAVINPLEITRKGRDTERQATASQLKNSLDAFNATYGCWPWEWVVATSTCNTATNLTTDPIRVVPTLFAAAGQLNNLIAKSVIKDNITQKTSIQKQLLWLDASAGEVNMAISFEPESNAGRLDNVFGPTVNDEACIGVSTVGTCDPATNPYGASAPAGLCWVCVQ